MTISDTLTARLITTAARAPQLTAKAANAATTAATKTDSVSSLSTQATVAEMDQAILSSMGKGGASVMDASNTVNELNFLIQPPGSASSAAVSEGVGVANAEASIPNLIITGTVANTAPVTYTSSGALSHPETRPLKAYA